MKWLIFFNWIISTESNPNVCTFIPISNIILTLIEIVLLKRMYNMKISSILLLPTSYGKNMMEPLANNSHVRSLFELLSVQWILNVCMFKWNGLAAIIYLSSFIIVRDDDKTMKNYAIHSGPGLKINKNYNR